MTGQAQEFAVEVPGRNGTPDKLPISRIRITLEFSSSVPSSLQLERVGPTATASLQVSPQSFGQASNGKEDKVRFRKTGVKTVEIELQPRSNFRNWLDDKCNRNGGGTGEFAMRLTNSSSIDITGYRLTSYRALSDPHGCQANQANRRISVQPATWKAGSQPSGTDLGRHPIRIAMVLDESGSMGTTVSGKSMTRMEQLRKEAGMFIDTWGTLSNAPSDDRFGVVFFTTGIRTLGGSGSFFEKRGSGSGSGVPSAWQTISNEINAATPQQRTAMGEGLKKAYDLASGDENVSIVLFTDGIENEGEYRTKPCSEITSVTCPITDEMSLYNSSQKKRISIPSGLSRPVQTIAIGAPGSKYVQDLDDIATQTGGESKSGLRSEAMRHGFGNALLDILNAGTLQRIFRVSSTLAEGDQSGVSRTVRVNRSADQLIVRLSWDELGNRYALNLNFEGPDGQSRSPNTRLRREGYRIASFDLNSGDAGEWRISVNRGDSGGELNYDLSTLVDETTFRYRLSWNKSHYFTGDKMYLIVTPTENGQPTSEFRPSNIQAELQRPSEALGTLMYESEAPDSALAGGSGDTPGTSYGQKLQYLLGERDIEGKIQPSAAEAPLQVQDSVVTSDSETIGGRGSAVVTLPIAKVPGTYRVNLRLRGKLEQSGFVERTDEVETQVSLRPNLAASEVKAEAADNSLQVQFVPRDRFDNFLGPGYESRLEVTSPGRDNPYPVDVTDEQTRGVYRMAVEDVPLGENPRLIFQLNGHPYHAVRVDQLISGEIPSDPNLQAGTGEGGEGFGCSCSMSSEGSNTASIPFFLILLLLTSAGHAVYRRLRLGSYTSY